MRKTAIFMILLLLLVPVVNADPFTDWFRGLFGITGKVIATDDNLILKTSQGKIVEDGKGYTTNLEFISLKGEVAGDITDVKISFGNRPEFKATWADPSYNLGLLGNKKWTALIQLTNAEKNQRFIKFEAKAYKSNSLVDSDYINIRYSSSCSNNLCLDQNVDLGSATDLLPLADAGVDQTFGNAPLTVQFEGILNSVSPGNAPITYLWNFGDGTASNLQNPSHRYNIARTYTANLKVTDSDGDYDYSDNIEINVKSCGNGSVDPGEECDFILTNNQITGVNLNGKTCANLIYGSTYPSAQLGCYPPGSGSELQCKYITLGCNYNKIPCYSDSQCGNSNCDLSSYSCIPNQQNHAPVLAPISAKQVIAKHLLTFTLSATDVDGNTLTYSTTPLPTGATFNPATKTFRWTPSTAGASTVTFIVTDTGGLSDSKQATITVTSASAQDRDPTLALNSPSNIADGQTYTTTQQTLAVIGTATAGNNGAVVIEEISYAGTNIPGISTYTGSTSISFNKQISLTSGTKPLKIVIRNNVGNQRTIKIINIRRNICAGGQERTYTGRQQICVCTNTGCNWQLKNY